MSRCQVSRYAQTAPLRLPPLWASPEVVMYDSSVSTLRSYTKGKGAIGSTAFTRVKTLPSSSSQFFLTIGLQPTSTAISGTAGMRRSKALVSPSKRVVEPSDLTASWACRRSRYCPAVGTPRRRS